MKYVLLIVVLWVESADLGARAMIPVSVNSKQNFPAVFLLADAMQE